MQWCTYDLCVMLLLRAASITWASGRGLGPGNREFFGPCEMASSPQASAIWDPKNLPFFYYPPSYSSSCHPSCTCPSLCHPSFPSSCPSFSMSSFLLFSMLFLLPFFLHVTLPALLDAILLVIFVSYSCLVCGFPPCYFLQDMGAKYLHIFLSVVW